MEVAHDSDPNRIGSDDVGGRVISVDFQRDGEPMTATVTLGENPDDDAAPLLGIRYWSVPSFGSVRAHFGDLRERFEAPGLGRVVHPGLDARAAGGVSYGRVRIGKCLRTIITVMPTAAP